MPTTLVTHSAAIGLGQMGIEIARNVRSIDSVILLDFEESNPRLDFEKWNVLGRARVEHANSLKPLLKKLVNDSDRKFLYIERSRGLSKFTPYHSNFLIPMWEQEIWKSEIKHFGNIISVTKHTERVIRNYGRTSTYLPWPLPSKEVISVNPKLKNILHNAGSFGGDFRKGTPEAIKIFQESGISRFGVSLKITAWRKPDKLILDLIENDPRGITLQIGYVEDMRKLYLGADLLLYPSRVEGHALPLLESFSYGLPALFTDAVPVNEYDSDARFTIPIERQIGNRTICSVEMGSERLKRILEVDLTQKSAEVLAIFESEYSWTKNLQFYESLLA